MARNIGDILLNMDDEHLSEGETRFQKAIYLFRECGADGWVTRTEKTLAGIA